METKCVCERDYEKEMEMIVKLRKDEALILEQSERINRVFKGAIGPVVKAVTCNTVRISVIN